MAGSALTTMPNLRVIYDNVAASATLTASTTSGTLAAANLLTDTKSAVHRSTSTSVTYTMTWSEAQTIGAVALPATNLTSAATVRVRLYSDMAGTTQIADSGTVSACPSSMLGLYGWPGAINANAFAHGGASKAAVWFLTQLTAVRRCVVTLTDTGNPAGYIDCARLVLGPYWEAPYNPRYGATAGTAGLTKTERSESGDQLTVRGAQYQTMSLDLAMLNETDRAQLAKIFRSIGTHRNVFLSLFPGNSSASAEQDHMIYGKRASGLISLDFFNAYSTKFDIDGW